MGVLYKGEIAWGNSLFAEENDKQVCPCWALLMQSGNYKVSVLLLEGCNGKTK